MAKAKSNIYINGSRLRSTMSVCSMTEDKLAKKIGVTAVTIQRARRQNTISKKCLYAVAEVLNVSPVYLCDPSEDAVYYSWSDYEMSVNSPLEYMDKQRETGESLILSGLNYLKFPDADNSFKSFDFKKIQDQSMNPETGSFMDYLNEQVSLWLRMNGYLQRR